MKGEEYIANLAARIKDHAEKAEPGSPDQLLHEGVYTLLMLRVGWVGDFPAPRETLAEYIRHLDGCRAIGGNGDKDCNCGAVSMLDKICGEPRPAEYEAPRNMQEPLRVRGVGRISEEPRALIVALSERPTDDELRSFHDHARLWAAMTEDEIATEVELVERCKAAIRHLMLDQDEMVRIVIPLVREAEREDCAARVMKAPPGTLRTREAIAAAIRKGTP